MQAMYEKFNAWRQTFHSHLVDLGGRLGSGRIALPEPQPDGPLVEVKELVAWAMGFTCQELLLDPRVVTPRAGAVEAGLPQAYAAAARFWVYPIFMIIVVGTWRTHHRGRDEARAHDA